MGLTNRLIPTTCHYRQRGRSSPRLVCPVGAKLSWLSNRANVGERSLNQVPAGKRTLGRPSCCTGRRSQSTARWSWLEFRRALTYSRSKSRQGDGPGAGFQRYQSLWGARGAFRRSRTFGLKDSCQAANRPATGRAYLAGLFAPSLGTTAVGTRVGTDSRASH
jgi:hypothetical protein